MNERTHFFIKYIYIYIYITLYSRKGWCFYGVCEMSGETYTLREDFFFPYLLPGSRGCQHLHLWSAACPTLDCNSLPLYKTDRVVLITWSPSGYTPVRPECPDAPSSSRLLIKMWQLTKVHGVTRNEPKIHGICYITIFEFLGGWGCHGLVE